MQNFKSIYWIQIPPFGTAKKQNKSSYIWTRVLLYPRAAIWRLTGDIISYIWEAKTLCGNSPSFSIYSAHLIFIVKGLVSLDAVSCEKPPTSECIHFCEARRASHCHSPQTTYSSKSTCCVLSAQKSAMHVVVYADRRTIQHSILDIIDWPWSYWQIWYPSWHVECFWADLSLHTNFRLLHLPLFCNNIHGGK